MLLVAVAPATGSGGLLAWSLDPNNAITVSAYAFWIGVVGTVISLLGFGITIYQLRQTRLLAVETAAATNKAIEGVKSRISTYDAGSELSRAVALLQETQRHIKTPSWESFVVSYSGARDALIRLIELPSSISVEDRSKLSKMLVDINSICANVNSGILANQVNVDRGRTLKLASEYEQTLTRISVSFQRGII